MQRAEGWVIIEEDVGHVVGVESADILRITCDMQTWGLRFCTTRVKGLLAAFAWCI
jgi:hypothetical protein